MDKKKNYEYVIVVFADDREQIIDVVGCKSLEVYTELVTDFATQKDPIPFKGLTKKEANKRGLKPSVICLGQTRPETDK